MMFCSQHNRRNCAVCLDRMQGIPRPQDKSKKLSNPEKDMILVAIILLVFLALFALSADLGRVPIPVPASSATSIPANG